jgi:ATP-dependent helicase/nuclease subunit B
LGELASRHFGEKPLATVSLQIEQARLRLKGFARWQAAHRRDGWRIRYAEEEIPAEKAFLLVDGTPMYLRGRIDRIDFNERSKEWLLLDYKTSDGAEEPDRVHRDGDAWVDLQLPLYRHLAKALDVSGRLRLGYIVLPKSLAGAQCKYAEWSDDDLATADAVAAEVVRSIRQQRFWPPADNFASFDLFSIICQADQFGAQSALAGDEEDGP